MSRASRPLIFPDVKWHKIRSITLIVKGCKVNVLWQNSKFLSVNSSEARTSRDNFFLLWTFMNSGVA